MPLPQQPHKEKEFKAMRRVITVMVEVKFIEVHTSVESISDEGINEEIWKMEMEVNKGQSRVHCDIKSIDR